MLKKPEPRQTAFEMVGFENLASKDHLLRRIDGKFTIIIDIYFSPDNAIAHLNRLDRQRARCKAVGSIRDMPRPA